MTRHERWAEIAEAIKELKELKEQGTALSATAVREVLRELGFAALPRRLDEERPDLPRPTVESAADARAQPLPSALPHTLRGIIPVPARPGAPGTGADG